MTRKEYLISQKEEKGRKLFGIFPAYYPKEILWAMNVLPVEVWDPPLEVSHTNAHLQPYICSVVKLGLELILQDKCKNIDGFLFPHTCDSIQNLASIVYDYLGLNKPCYFFYHPKAPYRRSSRTYYLEQLRSFVSRLERDMGPLDGTELKHRVEQGHHLFAILREIYDFKEPGGVFLPPMQSSTALSVRESTFILTISSPCSKVFWEVQRVEMERGLPSF